MLIKNNSNTKGIKLFEDVFLHTAYLNYSTFFLKNFPSTKQLVQTFKDFSKSKTKISKESERDNRNTL